MEVWSVSTAVPNACPSRVGLRIEDAYEHQYRGVMEPSPLGDGLTEVNEEIDADVVVFQTPADAAESGTDGGNRRRGAAIVVEIDDDFSALPLRHPARAENDPMTNQEQNWKVAAAGL